MIKSYNSIDLLKFLCSIGIVALHIPPVGPSSGLLPYINFVTSLCVPLFFIFSSFLFFNNKKIEVGYKDIKKFVTRLSILYVCWFIINLIINPSHTKFGNIIVNVILGNTFPGSWFYSALVVSTLIVFGLSKIKKIFWIIFPLCIYIYISMNFSGLLNDGLFNWYQNNIQVVFLSLPYALVWTTIGYLLNKNKWLIVLNAMLIISFVVLWLMYEDSVIEIVSWYVRLVLSELIAFFCVNYNITLKLPYKYLRNISTLIFMIHFYFLFNTSDIFCGNINFKFFTATILSVVISIIIIKLSKMKYLSVLRRLY